MSSRQVPLHDLAVFHTNLYSSTAASYARPLSIRRPITAALTTTRAGRVSVGPGQAGLLSETGNCLIVSGDPSSGGTGARAQRRHRKRMRWRTMPRMASPGVALGAFPDPFPSDPGALPRYAQMCGRLPAIVQWFSSWELSSRTSRVCAAAPRP